MSNSKIHQLNDDITYTITYSARKTMSIQIDSTGNVSVKAPRRVPESEVIRFVTSKSDWIIKHIEKLGGQNITDNIPKLTPNEIRQLADAAVKIIPERVKYYAPLVGVTYGRITIRNQHTRWGSCSGKGNLNFNCLLMLTPPEVIDSVVVHELCHRKEMNHSKKFYEEVYRVFPDYKKWDNWLKVNGPAIMRRM